MDDLDLGATIKGFGPGQKVFNRYTLKKILGRGGMGVVWLAQDGELDREVALKFLPEVVAMDKDSLDELRRETRRNLDLTHPYIVRIYDFVQDGRAAAISMEYVDGASLSALKVGQPDKIFPIARVEPWLRQLCGALSYAHKDAMVVHRDLKPANLMIDARGRLKITDFGIARSISDSVSRVSAQAGSSGTPVYMSPQQMMGDKPAVTDDVYSLGATLYELLTGKPPFYSGNIVAQVQSKVPPTLTERRKEFGVTAGEVPERWEALVAACLAKDPAQRPQSMGKVLRRLDSSSTTPTTPATPPVKYETVPAPAAPQGWTKPLLIGLSLLLVLALSAFVYQQFQDRAAAEASRTESARAEAARVEAARLKSERLEGEKRYLNWRDRMQKLKEIPDVTGEQLAALERDMAALDPGYRREATDILKQAQQSVELRSKEQREKEAVTAPIKANLKIVPLGTDSPLEMLPVSPGSMPRSGGTLRFTKPYWISSRPVSQAQWSVLMKKNPTPGGHVGASLPVRMMYWRDAADFCELLTERERQAGRLPPGYEYSLPTEAEHRFATNAYGARPLASLILTKDPSPRGWRDWLLDWASPEEPGDLTDPPAQLFGLEKAVLSQTGIRYERSGSGDEMVLRIVLRPVRPEGPPAPAITISAQSQANAWAWIPPGDVRCGSNSGADWAKNKPVVRHTEGFWIATKPVSQAEWESVMGENPLPMASRDMNAPVEMISWEKLQEFCRRLNEKYRGRGLPQGYRFDVPTEAQYEFACARASYLPARYRPSFPVIKGGYAVWEWCRDWHEPALPAGSYRDYAGPATGTQRVNRAGQTARGSYPVGPGQASSGITMRLVITRR